MKYLLVALLSTLSVSAAAQQSVKLVSNTVKVSVSATSDGEFPTQQEAIDSANLRLIVAATAQCELREAPPEVVLLDGACIVRQGFRYFANCLGTFSCGAEALPE